MRLAEFSEEFDRKVETDRSERNPFTGQSSTADYTGSNPIALVTSITSIKMTHHMMRGEVLLYRLVVGLDNPHSKSNDCK